jgi:hypothetical protein
MYLNVYVAQPRDGRQDGSIHGQWQNTSFGGGVSLCPPIQPRFSRADPARHACFRLRLSPRIGCRFTGYRFTGYRFLSWTLANFRAPETAISQAFRMFREFSYGSGRARDLSNIPVHPVFSGISRICPFENWPKSSLGNCASKRVLSRSAVAFSCSVAAGWRHAGPMAPKFPEALVRRDAIGRRATRISAIKDCNVEIR